MPEQLSLLEAPALVIKPKRKRAKKKDFSCTQCYRFLRVKGRPACTHIPQKAGKPPYKFLKSLKPCEDFWRAK